MSTSPATPDPFSQRYVNLAQQRLGARVAAVSDDFFAAAERMLSAADPVFIPGKYDDNGKWMDGWESRRKREEGFDHCTVRLGVPGAIAGVVIDTRHFVGNYPMAASLEACQVDDGDPDASTGWTTLIEPGALGPDAPHAYEVASDAVFTHVRLNIFPDGGVARLRVYGTPHYDWAKHDDAGPVDLVAFEHGGRAIECSDQGFGTSMHNLLLPGRGIDMGDGWETPRRRTPGFDWVILALGHRGLIEAVEIDTAHYKGNFPARASIVAASLGQCAEPALPALSLHWPILLPPQPLRMDSVHRFRAEIQDTGPVTHVRIDIHPDGGLSRVRLFGRPA